MPDPRPLEPGSPIPTVGDDGEVLRRSQRMRWATLASLGVLGVALPAALGFWSIAAVGAGVGFVFLAASRLRRRHPILARSGTHVTIAAASGVAAYATLVVGVPSVVTVYVSSLVLLAAAHVLGARAAVAWAVPCMALSVLAVYAPPPVTAPVSLTATAAVRVVVILSVLGFAASFRMHQDRQAAAMADLALTDVLTGLANRRQLERALQDAIDRAQRFGRQCAVVFADLDGMKKVNDALGHAAGDALLREVAQRIVDNVRRVDTAARLGGDEFVVVLSELGDREGAARFASKLFEQVSEPLELEGRSLRPSMSLGIALYPGASDSAKELLHLADAAMYSAKQTGGGCRLRDADGLHTLF